MSHEFSADRLDVRAFAQARAQLTGAGPLSDFERLMQDAPDLAHGRMVQWQAQGEMRSDAAGLAQIWLHLRAQTTLPMICQRCMEPVDLDAAFERSFRFVATEARAEEEDEEAEEDVLALDRNLNLLHLVEDELLMALPLAPRHQACPREVRLATQDADFDAATDAKPQPFAVLAALKGRQSDEAEGAED